MEKERREQQVFENLQVEGYADAEFLDKRPSCDSRMDEGLPEPLRPLSPPHESRSEAPLNQQEDHQRVPAFFRQSRHFSQSFKLPSLKQATQVDQKFMIRATMNDVPGLFLFALWLMVYVVFVYALRSYSSACANVQTDESEYYTMKKTMFVKILAVFLFSICILMDLSGMLFQISAKKRTLNSLVLFINLVACTVYLSYVTGVLPVLHDLEGRQMFIERYFQWMNTTPCMLFVLHALGSSMEKELVISFSSLFRVLISDELMILTGLVHAVVGNSMIGCVACFLSCCFFLDVLRGVHAFTNSSVARAATTYEIASLRSLEISTFLLWSVFPVVHLLHYGGFISTFQYDIAQTFVDILTKSVYTVTLLTGNFCILDTVAEVRIAQLQAEKETKHKNVIRTELMNQALQTAMLEAETSSRLSRHFLANISHELRTPLNSVVAFNSLLLESEDLSAAHKDYVRSSLTSADALLTVINQVLDYAKLEAKEDNEKEGKGGEEKEGSELMEEFSLLKLGEDLSDLIASCIKSDLDFAVDIQVSEADAELFLYGDAFHIRQCAMNLCDNAMKFSPEQGGEVTLRMRLSDLDEASSVCLLHVEVEDNGIGIPEDKLNLLFKPFSQVSSQYTRLHQGTGLGLAITKKLVDSMHGSISCQSRGAEAAKSRGGAAAGGTGTVFCITVPLHFTRQPVGVNSTLEIPGLQEGTVILATRKGPSSALIMRLCKERKVRVVDLRQDKGPVSKQLLVKLQAAVKAQGDRPFCVVVDMLVYEQLSAMATELSCLKSFLILGGMTSQLCLLKKKRHDEASNVIPLPIKPSVLFSKIFSSFTEEKKSPALPSFPYAAKVAKETVSSGNVPALEEAVKKEAEEDNRMRILVVEDQIANQKVAVALLQRVFGKDKVAVDIANNGEEGVAAASSGSYDLILMDIQMPIMDGLEASRKIREWEKEKDRKKICIIAVTAHTSPAHVEECMQAGMDRHFSKPLSLSLMRSIVEDFDDWKGSRV